MYLQSIFLWFNENFFKDLYHSKTYHNTEAMGGGQRNALGGRGQKNKQREGGGTHSSGETEKRIVGGTEKLKAGGFKGVSMKF